MKSISHKDLADSYGVDPRTMSRWVNRILEKSKIFAPGQKNRIYTPAQLKVIYTKLGDPRGDK